jgi:hypothetical protein
LQPNATYTVTDIDTGETTEWDGKTLTEQGLTVTIPEKYMSKILVYKIKA